MIPLSGPGVVDGFPVKDDRRGGLHKTFHDRRKGKGADQEDKAGLVPGFVSHAYSAFLKKGMTMSADETSSAIRSFPTGTTKSGTGRSRKK